LNCEEPNPSLDSKKGFFYINTKNRPWIHGEDGHPRRAGVSAFGFGGINAHVILEEHSGKGTHPREHLLEWESELILVDAPDRASLIRRIEELARYLREVPEVELRDVAFTLLGQKTGRLPCLSIVATSTSDLLDKISVAGKKLEDPERRQIKDRAGIYYFEEPLDPKGRLAFLFPGEGAQYPDMLQTCACSFRSSGSVSTGLIVRSSGAGSRIF